MKILFSTLQYPTKSYPFAAFISMIAEEFARLGHEVTVIAPQSITRSLLRKAKILPFYEEIRLPGVEFPIKVYRPKSITFGEGNIRGRLTVCSNKKAVTRSLKKISCAFDVIYAHFWEAVFNVVKYSCESKIPLVAVSGEDKITLNKYLSANETGLLRSTVAKVIGVSSKNVKESIDNGLADSSKCIVIPNGPDIRELRYIEKTDARRILNIPSDIFIVAFVGRFIHRKGALRVERAVQRLHDPKIKTIFIGSTMNDEDKSQEPCGKEVLFKGILPHNEISTWLYASDVFVLPTLAEGCSNSIVEAMACGLPIISSDRNFNYDVLNQDNAILVNPLDIDQIAEAIKKLQNSPDLRRRMGESSIKKSKEISFENRVNKIISILDTLRR